jgi:5-hydroxyisourate hydrolase
LSGGISLHIFDVSRGVPADGLRVEVKGPDGAMLLDARTSPQGTLDCRSPATGTYEAIFHIGDWFRARGVKVPSPAFLEVVPVSVRGRRYRAALSPAAQDDAVGLFTFPWRGLMRGMTIA